MEACPAQALIFGELEDLSKDKRMITAETVVTALDRTRAEKSEITPLDLLRRMGGTWYGKKKIR